MGKTKCISDPDLGDGDVVEIPPGRYILAEGTKIYPMVMDDRRSSWHIAFAVQTLQSVGVYHGKESQYQLQNFPANEAGIKWCIVEAIQLPVLVRVVDLSPQGPLPIRGPKMDWS